MKQIVTIGGGSGQFELLQHLKKYAVDIAAIVSMMDDGGSTGKLRSELNVLPPGDIRRCVMALARDNLELAHVLEYRFASGELKGHTVGNILLSGFELNSGNFQTGLDVLSKVLNIKGQVLPVTLDQATLCVKLEDGTVIEGETNIDIPKHDASLAIEEAYLTGEPAANPEAVKAIMQADLIVLTIGDVYTSVIPNLLIPQISQAVRESQAKVVYTCNQSTKVGETNNFAAIDYINTLEKYLGAKRINYIIVNKANGKSTEQHVVKYDQHKLKEHGVELIESDIESTNNKIDGEKLAESLFTLCQQL